MVKYIIKQLTVSACSRRITLENWANNNILNVKNFLMFSRPWSCGRGAAFLECHCIIAMSHFSTSLPRSLCSNQTCWALLLDWQVLWTNAAPLAETHFSVTTSKQWNLICLCNNKSRVIANLSAGKNQMLSVFLWRFWTIVFVTPYCQWRLNSTCFAGK